MVPTVESLTLVGPKTVEVCWHGTCTTEDLDVGRVVASRPAVEGGRVSLSTPEGRWELTDTAVWWHPTAGPAVERLRVEDPGLATREGNALWVSTRKGLFRITPTDIRSFVDVDAGLATGHGERIVSVERGQLHAGGPDLPACDLPLDATPRALAFNGRQVVLYGADVLVADVVACRVVSALDLAVEGATWDGDDLLIASGGNVRVQRVDWRTLEVATVAGIRSADRVSDGPEGPVLASRGAVWDLRQGTTRALSGNEVAFPGGYVRIVGHSIERLDATGAPIARYPLGKLRTLAYADSAGDAVLVGDASRLRMLGGRDWAAPKPIIQASLVGPGHVRVRMSDIPGDGAAGVEVDSIIDLAGAEIPVPAGSGPIWPTATGQLTLAASLRPGPMMLMPTATGLQAWAQVDGRERGAELPLVPEAARITREGSFVVTVQAGFVTGWEVASGRTRWTRSFDRGPKLVDLGSTFVQLELGGEQLLLDPGSGATVWTIDGERTIGEPGGTRWRMGDPAAPRWPARPAVCPLPARGAEVVDARAVKEALVRLTEPVSTCRASAQLLALFDRVGSQAGRDQVTGLCTVVKQRRGAWPEVGAGNGYTTPSAIRWVEAHKDGGALVMAEGALGRLDAGMRRMWARAADSGQALGERVVLGRDATLNAWRSRDGAWLGSVHSTRYSVAGGRLWVTGAQGDRFALDAALRVVDRRVPRRYGTTEAFGWTCGDGVCSYGAGTGGPVHIGTVNLRLVSGTVVASRSGRPVWRQEGVRFVLPIDHARVLLVRREEGVAVAVNAAGDTLTTFGPEQDWSTAGGVVWGWSGSTVHRYAVTEKPEVMPTGVVVDGGE